MFALACMTLKSVQTVKSIVEFVFYISMHLNTADFLACKKVMVWSAGTAPTPNNVKDTILKSLSKSLLIL